MNDQIVCTNVSAGYSGPPGVRDIDLEISSDKITVLVGPSGYGKSTLLKTIGRQLGIEDGDISLGGRSIAGFGACEFARRLSFLPQQPTVPEGAVTRELITFGRYPYTGAFASLAEEDHRAIEVDASVTRVLDYLDPAHQLAILNLVTDPQTGRKLPVAYAISR